MKDFAAIDFETANQYPASVCSIGVVTVRNGIISDKYYSLIKPEPEYYSYGNSRVHGLTIEDTQEAPIFPTIWNEVEPLIQGLPLVAHNKSFDENCLKAAFKMYQLDYPDYEFHCSVQLSRKAFKHLPNHKLSTVAEYIGFTFKHHHALEDAEACARIVLEASDYLPFAY